MAVHRSHRLEWVLVLAEGDAGDVATASLSFAGISLGCGALWPSCPPIPLLLPAGLEVGRATALGRRFWAGGFEPVISWEGLGNGGSSCTPSPSGCRERLLLSLKAATAL